MVYHFKTEEKYMQNFKFTGYQAHKKEHEGFVNKVDAFQNDFDEGKLGLSIEVMTFLRDWVLKHIKETDKKYIDIFKENGL